MWCGRTLLFVASCGLPVLAGSTARAAQLSVVAPDSCVDPATLADEVSDLIGKPLGSVADVDFRVEITERPQHRWLLRLETIGPPAAGRAVRASREIEGATCAELAEAASVAIAVSVRSMAAESAAPPARPLPPPPPPDAAPAPTLTQTPAARPAPPWRPSIAVALTLATGTLPSPSPGLELEGVIVRRWLRLTVLGAWYTSQNVVGSGDVGGTFNLALGGALACFAPRRGRLTALTCGGFELGRLAGTGLGVGRPETGAAFWRAARLEGGLDVAVDADAALLLRGGFAFPLTRPDFVLDQSQLVYEPARLAGRITAGIELGF